MRALQRKAESEAKAALAHDKGGKDLSSDDLTKLLRWKMPSSSSKIKGKSAKMSKWTEVRGLPEPLAPKVTELSELPFAAELGRMKVQMAARAAPPAGTATAAAAAPTADGPAAAAATADGPAAATPAAQEPRAAFDPERATLDELDAQMELLASRKARIQRDAANEASAGTGSAAAAAMTSAAEVPQGGKRAHEPALGGAPQSNASPRKSQRAPVPKKRG